MTANRGWGDSSSLYFLLITYYKGMAGIGHPFFVSNLSYSHVNLLDIVEALQVNYNHGSANAPSAGHRRDIQNYS